MNPDVTVDTPTEVLKGAFIRGLTEARMRNPGTNLAQYIEAYITVQVSCQLLVTRGQLLIDMIDIVQCYLGPRSSASAEQQLLLKVMDWSSYWVRVCRLIQMAWSSRGHTTTGHLKLGVTLSLWTL